MTTKFLTGGALAALAAALAFTAVPAAARPPGDRDQSAWQGNHRGGGGAARDSQRAAPAQRYIAPRAEAPRPQPAPVNVNRGNWAARGGDQRGQAVPQNNGDAWRGWSSGQRATAPINRTYVDPNRNRTYVDPNRNQTYQDARRGDDQRGNGGNWQQNQRNDSRNWQQDRRGNDRTYRGADNDNRQWNRGWRNDNRYDWQRYRADNRNVYHLGRYYAPYRDYSYRRLGIGFYLDPLFFSNQYWISDPWQYRLPDVYGPYRWVRYYDDALLVNVYTGEVVDVIYDFFW